MNQTASSVELKSMAKGQLLGKYSTVASATIIIEIIAMFAPLFINLFLSFNGTFGLIMYYLILFIVQLFLGIFRTGEARLYLNISCNRPYQISDIFYGFKVQPNKSLFIILFQTLIQTALCLPLIITIIIYAVTKSDIMILFITIALLFALVLSCITGLMFSQAFYLLVDLPRYSAWELLKISTKIMKGNKGRLFYLQVSFLGMLLLELFSCGIGSLWISPYIAATNANFYLNLMNQD